MQYPLGKILGSLYDKILQKLNFGKLDYTINPTAEDWELEALEVSLINKKFSDIEMQYNKLSSEKKGFALEVLGQIKYHKLIDKWLLFLKDDVLAKVANANMNINWAWNIRGKSAHKEDLDQFKNILNDTFFNLKILKSQSNKYILEINTLLLKLGNAVEVERSNLHKWFNEALSIQPDFIALHFNYFECISLKWGGSIKELELYFNQKLPAKPEIIKRLVLAMYYKDLCQANGDEKLLNEGKRYLQETDCWAKGESNIYKYQLYLELFFLAAFTSDKALEIKYKQLVNPFIIFN